MEALKKINLTLNCDQPECFVASQWQTNKCKPNIKYLIYRCIIATYFSFVVIWSFHTASQCKQLNFYGIYLTNWNVILNGFSSLFAAVLVTMFYMKKFTFDPDPNETITRSEKMKVLFKVFWVAATLSTAISISLSLIYWPFIYVGRDDGLNDALTHGGNAVVNFIDLFIHAHPARYGHVLYVFFAGAIYIFFSVLYTLLGGTDRDLNNYIYSVIDWRQHTGHAIAFAAATIIFLSIMHFVLTAFISLRCLIHKRICGSVDQDKRDENMGSSNLGFSA